MKLILKQNYNENILSFLVVSPTTIQQDGYQKERDNSISGSKRSSQHHDDNSTFYNPIAADVSYSIRHVEESWHHLMRSDDTTKFKQIAVCNFDFLLAAVSVFNNFVSPLHR